MDIALPSHRGKLIAIAGASGPAKAELVDALVKVLGSHTLVIGNRSCPDPETSMRALLRVDGRAADDAVTVVRMAESVAVRACRTVVTTRPVVDELARYRAGRRLRHEHVQHHLMRRVEDTVAWESADYDCVVWVRSPFPSRPVQIFERALSEVFGDLCVPHHSVYPPLLSDTVERLVTGIGS